MEETTNFITVLLCAVVPCLLFLAALAGGIFYFVKRRNKAAAQASNVVTVQPVSPVQQPASPPAPAPAAVPHAAGTGADLFSQAGSADPASPAPASPVPTAILEPASPVSSAAEFAIPPAAPVAPEPAQTGLKSWLISPSELAALRGQLFGAAAGVLNSWKVIGTENRVAGPELAQSVLAAAFLALEASGDITLEPGRKKAMLGLSETDTLYVLPTGQAGGWPAGSYEDAILAGAASQLPKNRHHVQHLTYTILGEDAGVPWDQALSAAHDGLAQRGLLLTTKEKVLLATVERRSLPAETAELAAHQDAGRVQSLLEQCQTTRPQVWQTLTREIKSGLDARHESSDD